MPYFRSTLCSLRTFALSWLRFSSHFTCRKEPSGSKSLVPPLRFGTVLSKGLRYLKSSCALKTKRKDCLKDFPPYFSNGRCWSCGCNRKQFRCKLGWNLTENMLHGEATRFTKGNNSHKIWWKIFSIKLIKDCNVNNIWVLLNSNL